MFSFVAYFCRYVSVIKNIRIEKTINALVIRTCFDATEIAIQRIAKHLNTTLDSAQLHSAVKLFARKRAALYVRTL